MKYLLLVLVGFFLGCSPDSTALLLPGGDIRPPAIVDAGQGGPNTFDILFDEKIIPVQKTFAFAPASTIPAVHAEENHLIVTLSPAVTPGIHCSLAGEVEDIGGNATRFFFTFTGYNEYPASLVLNEVQTGKNTSVSAPHRDFLEFVVAEGGNLGGMIVQWVSSVKIMEYRFAPCEVQKGAVIVLHCAPENIPEEKDELGLNLAESGGIDSSPSGRDFWASAGGIPDESGLIIVRVRDSSPPNSALFYSALEKSGPLESGKLLPFISELKASGIWSFSPVPRWEDAFQWKPSASKPIQRRVPTVDNSAEWYVGDSSTQSPGFAEPGSRAVSSKKTDKKGEAKPGL